MRNWFGASGGVAIAPAGDQVVARHRDQEQAHQADAERRDLQRARAAAPLQRRQRIPPADARAARARCARNARAAQSAARAMPPNTSRPPAKPPATMPPSFHSPAASTSSNRRTAARLRRRRPTRTRRSAPISRRITRTGGTRVSGNSGGTAKPSSSTSPVAMPCKRGPDARLRQFDIDQRAKPVQQHQMAAETEHHAQRRCRARPAPRIRAMKSERSVRWLTPRQRIAAQPSRCRRAKRCAAIAIATAASNAVSSETSVRK